jgi:ATP-dependent Clp protease ATP-binding subunit ClpB
MLKEEVGEEDIADVVSKWTHIPVSRLMEGEVQKLIHMEDRLHLRVIGQDEAINAVANAIRRARGPAGSNRPLGSFLFLGPTGVGKTELARALAEFLFDDEQAMIRIDMSDSRKHTVSRMVGAPPGYVGYEEAGQLTEAVRRRPYSVVLFDEVEKAHPEVLNVLLQLLDDGRLTDGKGRTIDFKNTVVIMTSNLGSQFIAERSLMGDLDTKKAADHAVAGIDEGTRRQVMDALRAHFKPEFLNRIDEIIFFHALSREHLKKIIDIQISGLMKRLAERKIHVELTDAAKEQLVREGYDPTYGARPLKRTIQRRVLDPLAMRVLEGDFLEGATVKVDAGADGLVFEKREPVGIGAGGAGRSGEAGGSGASGAPDRPAPPAYPPHRPTLSHGCPNLASIHAVAIAPVSRSVRAPRPHCGTASPSSCCSAWRRCTTSRRTADRCPTASSRRCSRRTSSPR